MILEREPATEFEEIGTVQFVATFKELTIVLNNELELVLCRAQTPSI